MYILWVLCGGLSHRCDYAWPWIRAGEFQCQQSDLSQRADAGAAPGAHGSQSGVCTIGNGCGRDGELVNFKISYQTPVPAGPALLYRTSSQFPVLGEYSSL